MSDNSLVAPSNHSGAWLPSPNRHRDLFSTPSETRAPGATKTVSRQMGHAIGRAGSVGYNKGQACGECAKPVAASPGHGLALFRFSTWQILPSPARAATEKSHTRAGYFFS